VYGEWRSVRYDTGSGSDQAGCGEGSFDGLRSLPLPVPYLLLIRTPIWKPI
jgi:hypothetical protein